MAELTLRNASSGRAQPTARPWLAAFLNRLPHLNLSDTGRRNVCARFGLTDAELNDALANAYGQKGGAAVLNPKLDSEADTLACALALTGKATPTPDALATALRELYPAGNGPTVPELLAAGWLVPTIDGRGLRVPPLPLAEQDARLAAYEPSVIQVVKRDVGGLTGQGARLAEAVPELVLSFSTSSPAPLAGQGARLARLAEAVPEGVVKLTTPPPAPLAGQDTRRAVFNSVNSTELAANSVDFTESAANPQGTGYHRPILNKRAEQDTRLGTASPLNLRELAAHATGPEFSPPEVKNPVGGKLPPAGPLFSYYRGPITNTVPHAAIAPGQLYRVLVQPPPYLRERADAARAEYAAHGKSPAYRALKNGLDYFTAGGTFAPTRADAHLAAASGYLALDFDELNGRVAEARAALLTDPALAPALVLVFVSPSGDGLKAVLRADPRHPRQVNYERLARHLTKRYGWGPTLDKGTFDVSRACFLSHDPDAWLAPAYAA